MRGDDAGVGGGGGAAASARDDLAAGHDRPRCLQRGVYGVVEDLRLPHHLAGDRVEGHQVVVAGGVEEQAVVDGDGALGGGQPAHVLAEVVGQVAPVLPDEVAGRRVDGLDDVAGVGHVEHAAVGEGRSLLASLVQGAGPHQAQVAHVVAVDLVEGAVAPAVEGAPPHEPVFRRRVAEHGIGHRHEVGRRRLRRGGGGLDGEPEQDQGRGRGRPHRRGSSESDTVGSSHRGRVRHVVMPGKVTAYAPSVAVHVRRGGAGHLIAPTDARSRSRAGGHIRPAPCESDSPASPWP